MRLRSKSAVITALMAVAASAAGTTPSKAQFRRPAPARNAEARPNPTQIRIEAPPDPMARARSPRHLIRNAEDYIGYGEYMRALDFLREAELRQGELTSAERKTLQELIARASQGAKRPEGAEPPSEIAYRRRPAPERPGAIALAEPPTLQDATLDDQFQLAGAEDDQPQPQSEAERPGRPEAPPALAAPSLDDRAHAPRNPNAAAPGRASRRPPAAPSPITLPPLPASLDDFRQSQRQRRDQTVAESAPQPRPRPRPRPRAAETAPPRIEPQPSRASDAPLTARPRRERAPAARPRTPIALPPLPPPAHELLDPSEGIAAPNDRAPSPTPDARALGRQAPADRAGGPTAPPPETAAAPAPAPDAASSGGASEPERGDLDAAPPIPDRGPGSAIAGPGYVEDPRRSQEPRRSRVRLSPEQEEEVLRMVRRQEEEAARARPAQQPRADRPFGGSPFRRDELTDSIAELPRAPSPTEARPIEPIPVPSDFVPLPPRRFEPRRKYWAAAATVHGPLYFQDAVLERYGQSVEQKFGPIGRFLTYPLDDPKESRQRNQLLQPIFSAGLFAAQIALWPYNAVMDPPFEPEYDLGYFRPGDAVPPDLIYLPVSGVGPPLQGSHY